MIQQILGLSLQMSNKIINNHVSKYGKAMQRSKLDFR